jgi:hypothetical protein
LCVVQAWPTRAKRICLQIRTFRAKFVVRRNKRKLVKGRAVARRGDDRGAQELTIGSPRHRARPISRRPDDPRHVQPRPLSCRQARSPSNPVRLTAPRVVKIRVSVFIGWRVIGM